MGRPAGWGLRHGFGAPERSESRRAIGRTGCFGQARPRGWAPEPVFWRNSDPRLKSPVFLHRTSCRNGGGRSVSPWMALFYRVPVLKGKNFNSEKRREFSSRGAGPRIFWGQTPPNLSPSVISPGLNRQAGRRIENHLDAAAWTCLPVTNVYIWADGGLSASAEEENMPSVFWCLLRQHQRQESKLTASGSALRESAQEAWQRSNYFGGTCIKAPVACSMPKIAVRVIAVVTELNGFWERAGQGLSKHKNTSDAGCIKVRMC